MSIIENFDIQTQVIDSVVKAFDTMVSMKIEVSDSEPPDTAGTSRMAAAVYFAGTVIGLINLQVSSDLSRLMTANMLGLETGGLEDEGEIKDFLAEISNAIAGNLKSELNDAGHPSIISHPCLTSGTDFAVKSLGVDQFERYVFTCQQEFILVEVGLKAQQVASDGDNFSFTDGPGNLANADAEKINALDIKAQVSEAVIEVFDTMLAVRLEPADEIPDESLENLRHVGSVSFAGDAAGMVSVQVGDNFTRELAAEMLGMDVAELEGDEKIQNMLGEVGNIVGGKLKSTFADVGLACALSTPSFTTGTDFKIESLDVEKYERFALRSGDNIVVVEMVVKIPDLVQAAGQDSEDSHYAVEDEAAENDIAEEKAAAAVQEGAKDQETGSVGPAAEDPLQAQPPYQPAATQTSDPPQPPPAMPPVHEAAPNLAESREPRRSEDFDLDLLLDIPLEIKVELGRAKIQLQELLKLTPGSAVKLVKLEGEPVDILANETLIARGEVVVQNEKYGIRVTEITSRMDRIRSFSI